MVQLEFLEMEKNVAPWSTNSKGLQVRSGSCLIIGGISANVPLYVAYYRRAQPKFLRCKVIIQTMLGTVRICRFSASTSALVVTGDWRAVCHVEELALAERHFASLAAGPKRERRRSLP